MIGLTHARRRLVGEFSKGMARRIGLAQALINDPDLVILDEPTSGLDPLGCRQMKDLILALARRGKTVVLSSHLLADVEDVCDRIAILYNGRIQAAGAMRELLEERGRSRFTLPELSPDALRRVLDAARDAAGCEPEIDHPRVSLERFFLDVVARAASPASPTGARAGAAVAGYLSDAPAAAAPAAGDRTAADERLRALVRPPDDGARPPP
jgi:ABC-2 type transport system ATP-binding protein